MSTYKRKGPTDKSPIQATPHNEQLLIQQALNTFKAGKISATEQLCEQLLKANPKHSPAHCLLSELYNATGRPDAAIGQLQLAIRAIPGDAQLHCNLGAICLNQGNLDYATSCLQQAIRLKPGFAEAYNLLGAAYRRAGRTEDAVAAYQKAITLRPDLTDTYYNLGIALTEAGQYREAEKQYHKLLAIRPNHADAYHGLGLCMDWLGDLDASTAYYERGLQLAPDHIGIRNNIASVYLAQKQVSKALEAFKISAEMKHDHGRPVKGPLSVILHRIRHDAEQLHYLDAKAGIPGEYRNCLNALTELVEQHAGKPGTDRVSVDADTAQRIAPSFNRIIHRAECPEIPGGALNSDIDWHACETAYRTAIPEVVTIDNFLRPEAVQGLHNYCLESTVWKTVRPYGYLGALISDGFATPLLLQIITEFRERMPRILAEHNLTQAWAYKYDSSLRTINVHADCAAVNINFWITPDSANKNPNNGGLVLWDKAPPPDWGLRRTQNPDKTEIIQFLETSGARTITVPHRQNRMVLFNSALFHKSGDMEFRDGYENRRINVTLLYGNGLR